MYGYYPYSRSGLSGRGMGYGEVATTDMPTYDPNAPADIPQGADASQIASGYMAPAGTQWTAPTSGGKKISPVLVLGGLAVAAFFLARRSS